MSSPAEGYESYMVPTLFSPWASRLVQAGNPQTGERILDLGCGTGVVARQAASRLGKGAAITGLDASPAMLAVARAASVREGAAIEWREGRAERLPFSENAFDLVMCQFALMFFDDKAGALCEAHRVLKRGGRLALSVWQGLECHPFYRTLDDVIRRRVGVAALASIFALGDPTELRSLLAGAGFQRVTIESVSMTSRFPDPPAFLAGEMQELDAAQRQDIVAAIREEMRAPLAEATEADHVVLQFHGNMAVAWR